MRRTFVMVLVSAQLFVGGQGLRAQPKGQRTTTGGMPMIYIESVK